MTIDTILLFTITVGGTLLILRVQMYKNIRFHTRKAFLISV